MKRQDFPTLLLQWRFSRITPNSVFREVKSIPFVLCRTRGFVFNVFNASKTVFILLKSISHAFDACGVILYFHFTSYYCKRNGRFPLTTDSDVRDDFICQS
jgi:hypothetical protein